MRRGGECPVLSSPYCQTTARLGRCVYITYLTYLTIGLPTQVNLYIATVGEGPRRVKSPWPGWLLGQPSF